MGGSRHSQDTIEDEKRAAQRTSRILFHASIAGFVGGVLLLIAFCSPYWLQSWRDTNSPFLNMGLWEFCFYRFRLPEYQQEKLLTGCINVMTSVKYREFREYLTPTWLWFVQGFMTLAFIVSFASQIIDVCLLLRWPLERLLRFEWALALASFLMKTVTTALILLTLIIFSSSCWDRDWLLYPNFNFVSYSFACACFAMVGHGVSAFLMFHETRAAKERRDRNMALVMQMYPTPGLFDGSLNTYHGSQFI